MINLNEMKYTMKWMKCNEKYRSNDIKMMLNLDGNLEII